MCGCCLDIWMEVMGLKSSWVQGYHQASKPPQRFCLLFHSCRKTNRRPFQNLNNLTKNDFCLQNISNTCIFYMWLKINNIALHQNHQLKNLFSWVLSQDVVKFIQYKGNVSPLWSWMEDNSPNIWRPHSMQYISNIYPI